MYQLGVKKNAKLGIFFETASKQFKILIKTYDL